ncbi:MAG: hypothetical protein J6X62_06610 [Bacteroidales bacterium]|nr:hypothetical protein [Bacteroidales bacterium]
MKLKVLLSLAAVMLVACAAGCNRHRNHLAGTWIEAATVSGVPQGITLGHNGWAASVNKPTLQYNHWTSHGKTLVLEGILFADNRVQHVKDTFVVEHVGSETMTLRHGDNHLRYFKQ